MKQFYVAKNANYVTICNKALRDKRLSLKAKGLYAVITSLPDGWDYTVAGLTAILKESRDAVRTAIIELEEAGYIKRGRVRNEHGQLLGAVYVVLEEPKPKSEESEPKSEKSTLVKTKQRNKSKDLLKETERKKIQKRNATYSIHFANERHYSREELDSMITDINDIDIDNI